MEKIKAFFASPHIQIALVTGFCIIAMSYISKHILSRSISYLHMALPPFLATLYECMLSEKEKVHPKLMKIHYWIAAILLATIAVILYYAL